MFTLSVRGLCFSCIFPSCKGHLVLDVIIINLASFKKKVSISNEFELYKLMFLQLQGEIIRVFFMG
jgi:hypothetical protein